MKRTLAIAIALGATLGTAGLASAQTYYYGPYGQTTYTGPAYTVAPPPAVYPAAPAYSYGYYDDGTHSAGGASRAYSTYGGGQKSN